MPAGTDAIDEAEGESGKIRLRDFRDLSVRIGVRSTDGGELIGGADFLEMTERDGKAEPALHPGESEVARMAGVVDIFGLCESGDDSYELGQAMHSPGLVIITTGRLIVMALGGQTLLGPVQDGEEVHTFVWPWDLVDTISMPAKKSWTDRLAGGRTIEIYSGLTMTKLDFAPARIEGSDGSNEKLGDSQAFDLLARSAALHRQSVAPETRQAELSGIAAGRYVVDEGDLVAKISDDYDKVPAHLVGRIEDDGE